MKKRVDYYDYLRVLSIFAVVIMHVIGNTLNTFGLSGSAANFYNGICKLMYFAVPMFVMISGALFLNFEKRLDIKTLYTKYILRILLCLFIFGFVYSILEIYFITKVISFDTLIQSIKNIFTGNLWAHMWYLYLIIGLYMITPLIRVFVNNCSRKEYNYILIILFIFTVLLVDFSKIFKINIEFNILIYNPYIFFYMLGDYLSRYEISKKIRMVNYSMSALFCILIFSNEFVSLFDKNLVAYTSFMMSSIIVTLFLSAKNCKLNFKKQIKNFLYSISECGFGIYLIHQFVINIIYKLLKFNIILKFPYTGLILYVMIVFLISYSITYLLRKIDIIRKYML